MRAGQIVAALVLLVLSAALVAVALRADAVPRLGSFDLTAIRFTVLQAALSALLSVTLAVPVARALARRQFRGRGLLITLLGAPFLLPSMVAILGLLAVFGRSGVLSQALGAVGLPRVEIYGLHGVVLAHIFFNLPLATRLVLQGWLSMPAERFRLAAALNFTPGQVARHLEWPMLRHVLPGALLVIFLICTTSFAVALALGGGPRATTVELAIYQAFRFEFDLGKAALLGAVQAGICGLAWGLARAVPLPEGFGAGLDRPVLRWEADRTSLRALDTVVLVGVTLFLTTPLLMVVARGAPGLLALEGQVWVAAGRSILVALGAVILALAMGLPLAFAAARGSRLAEFAATLPVALSSLVLGLGLFLMLFPVADPTALALPVTALVNAVMTLPFLLRSLLPEVRALQRTYGRLSTALGMPLLARVRWVVVPRLRRSLGFAAGLSAALSMGDLGVIVLFSDASAPTLPLMVFRLLAAYRMEDAAAAALLLFVLSLLAFWVFDRGGRADANL